MGGEQTGRWTHRHDGGLVVFLIGMRIGTAWRPDRWFPVLAGMRPMLAELHRDPASGFLGHRTLLGRGGPTVVQYWRSREDLLRYASDPGARHRPAWAAFNRRVRDAGGHVGIWHETYVVPPGGHESVYVDMPLTGLAAVTSATPVSRRSGAAPR